MISSYISDLRSNAPTRSTGKVAECTDRTIPIAPTERDEPGTVGIDSPFRWIPEEKRPGVSDLGTFSLDPAGLIVRKGCLVVS